MRQFHNQSPGTPLDRRLKEMWAAVEQETGGRIRVRTFAGNDNIPGGDPEARDMLVSGALEFYTLMGGILDEVVPIADIQGMPFAFKNNAQVYAALDGDIGALLHQEALTKGIYAVPRACFENGFRHITASTHPIRNAGDLSGMKIRVPASEMFADCFRSLGALPVSINTNRLYDALKSGMAEGQENPLAIVDGFKLYEVQRYVSLTAHMWSGYNLLANLAVWRRLPADVQDAIQRNAVKYVRLQRADNMALNASLQDGLAKRGMIFNTADTSGFRAPLADLPPLEGTPRNKGLDDAGRSRRQTGLIFALRRDEAGTRNASERSHGTLSHAEAFMVDIRHTTPAPIWPESLKDHWTLFLVEGAVLVVLGLAAMLVPVVASLAVALFLGWLFLIGGIVGAVTTMMHWRAPAFWWSLLSSIVTLIAGLLLVGWPVGGAVSLTLVLAVYLFAEGIASMMFAFRHRAPLASRWAWLFLNGVIDIVLASIVVALLPAGALWVLGIFVGIDFVFGGVSLIAMSLEARHAARNA